MVRSSRTWIMIAKLTKLFAKKKKKRKFKQWSIIVVSILRTWFYGAKLDCEKLQRAIAVSKNFFRETRTWIYDSSKETDRKMEEGGGGQGELELCFSKKSTRKRNFQFSWHLCHVSKSLFRRRLTQTQSLRDSMIDFIDCFLAFLSFFFLL